MVGAMTIQCNHNQARPPHSFGLTPPIALSSTCFGVLVGQCQINVAQSVPRVVVQRDEGRGS